jgi:hypothetical protein
MLTETPTEGFLNYNAAAKMLGTFPDVIGALVTHGIFSAPYRIRTSPSKLLHVEEVQRFAEDSIDASILARRLQKSVLSLKGHFLDSSVPFLEISIYKSKWKIFVLKEITKKVKIL